MRLGWIRRARSGGSPRDRQRGTTTVEFALVLPVVIAVMFGMIEGGRMIVGRVMSSYAAIHGARVASISSTATAAQVETAVINAAPLLRLTASSIDVLVNGVIEESAAFGARPAGAMVGVVVRYSFQPLLPSPFKTKTLQARSQVRM